MACARLVVWFSAFSATMLASALPAAALAAATLPGLRSPSGNISCIYSARTDPRNNGSLLCSIVRADYGSEQQRRCAAAGGLDWHGWELRPNRSATRLCAGGALWFGRVVFRTVPYGSRWHAGPYTCESASAGITCRTTGSHGLFISRASSRTW